MDSLINPKYRADIDGLRALSIVFVIIYHNFPEVLQGGFVGVDIFFVISGFLISHIIFNNLKGGTFNFVEFYSRRILRIFPALILILIFCLIFGQIVLFNDEYQQLAKHITASTAFVQNLTLWNEVGYFDNLADKKPLLHLWSLAVEEQFYLLFPFIIWITWQKKINIFFVLFCICIFSFYLNYSGVHKDLIGTFYSPLTRTWEFLIGSLAARVVPLQEEKEFLKNVRQSYFFTIADWVHKNRIILANMTSFAGIALLVSASIAFRDTFLFPGAWAAIPVISAFFIIIAGQKSWINNFILSNKLLVTIGKISYPLYLWHWVLLSFSLIILGQSPDLYFKLSLIVISFILAFLTYFYIERPIRYGEFKQAKTIILIGLSIVIGLYSFDIYSASGFLFKVKINEAILEFEDTSNASKDWYYPGNMKSFKFNDRNFYKIETSRNKTTFFIGDSNIEQYFPRIDELSISYPKIINSSVFLTGGGCFPIPEAAYNHSHLSCTGLMETALSYIDSDPMIRNVVISASWAQYFLRGENLDSPIQYKNENYDRALINFKKYMSEVRKRKKRIFIILSIPQGSELDPKFMLQRNIWNFPYIFSKREGGKDIKSFGYEFFELQNDLKKIAESEGAIIIEPMNYLCSDSNCPSVDKDKRAIYKDSIHLRSTYVRYNAIFVDEVMMSKSAKENIRIGF